jgi:plasmid stabilization system protein ParE
MGSYGFHSEAAQEYLSATRYYLDHASPLIAAAFVAEMEAAIQTLLASPITWPIIEAPHIRRYLLRRFRILLRRFPYSVYYRWEPEEERLSIYAVMHFSKLPGYWRHRS